MSKGYVPTIDRSTAYNFARYCVTCDSMLSAAEEARRIAESIPGEARRGTWKALFIKFADDIERGVHPFTIIDTKGNTKLKFATFSTLPIVTCPGAGACAGIGEDGTVDLKKAFCYSLRAWRYGGAFLRQCYNTLLLRFNKRAIIESFKALPDGIVFRLYVDGDFDSDITFIFWMNVIRQRPTISVYGYSKSWDIVLRNSAIVPVNYTMNISNGGNRDGDDSYIARLQSLPFVRERFIALSVKGKFEKGFAKYKNPEYHRAVRAAAIEAGFGKVFSCVGTCNTCCHGKHACGSTTDSGERVYNVSIPVAIGIH